MTEKQLQILSKKELIELIMDLQNEVEDLRYDLMGEDL